MSTPGTTAAIQKDWHDRETVEVVHLNIVKITRIMNEFDLSVRYKLARLSERINDLERTLEYLEATLGGEGKKGREFLSNN
ncbi:unnamed protein product [Phaeothamnion confervicola]